MKSFLTGGSLLASMLVLSACGSSTVSVGATSDAAEDGALGGGGGGVEPSDGATSDGAVATSDAGSDTQPVGTDAAPETSTTVPDGGGPSTTYPAFPVDIGTIANNGGPVLTAEQVVTITWTNDPDEAAYEAFGDTIGASNYWSTINSQYGVGPAVSGSTNHVRLTDTLPTSGYTEAQLESLLTTNLASTSTGWPAPNAQTVYIFYLPPNVDYTETGETTSDCNSGTGGYHAQFLVGSTVIVYAMVLHCPGFEVGDVTLSASHELNEAATDPGTGALNTNSGQGYNPAIVGFDDNHLAFEFLDQWQDELGDACEGLRDITYNTTETNFKYSVQRQWSNKDALAGHDPCVPGGVTPWVNLTLFPADEQAITVNFPANTLQEGTTAYPTQGYTTSLNTPVTFPVGFISDGPSSAWTISATVDKQIVEDPGYDIVNNGAATVTFDKTSGVNGDIAHVTVTPTSFGDLGIVYLHITSKASGAHDPPDLPIIIGQK